MMEAMATIDDWIAGLKDAAERGAELCMPAIVSRVQRAAYEALSAGKSLSGEPWQLTKDGRVPMRGAADALRVTSVGRTIVFAIGDPYVFHHFGAGRVPVRRIFPAGATPETIGNAIRLGVIEVLPFVLKRKQNPVIRRADQARQRAINANKRAKRGKT